MLIIINSHVCEYNHKQKPIFHQYLLTKKEIKKAILKTNTIVAPEARLNIYESHTPIIVSIIPNNTEISMIFFIL